MNVQDFTVNLDTFAFERGLSDTEKQLLYLRARSAGLTVCGCGHAVFVCRLFKFLREMMVQAEPGRAGTGAHRLAVGILGGGHIGKQLAQVLLEFSGLRPSDINISTKRLELLEDFKRKGIGCYHDNPRLAGWADVLFLCCLPSDLPQVSGEIGPHLRLHCLVYSLTSAVPLHRLARLLGHTSIIRPTRSSRTCDWLALLPHGSLMAMLRDVQVITASCPVSASGVCVDGRWLAAVLYGLLNSCTAEPLGARLALRALNDLLRCGAPATPLTCQSFVSAACADTLTATPDGPFPWINLIDAQSKETPLSRCLEKSVILLERISAAYHDTYARQVST